MKISVIVPIYKVEKYLRKCVDSILEQTYNDLEIILVDDGSPDKCPAICDEYVEKDNRIKVIHKENGGLSDARNAGLAIAQGEWLSFIDSDDWIEPDMYEKLIENALRYDAQISVGAVAAELLTDQGYRRIHPPRKTNNSCVVLSTKDAVEHFFNNAWAAWDKIYHRSIFEGIQYPVGEINEDEAIALHLLHRSDRVVYSDDEVYHYVVRPESITSSSFSEKKLAWVKHCRDNLAFVREKYPQLEKDAAARYRGSILWAMREIALSEGNFSTERILLSTQLKDESAIFARTPFRNPEERLRYLMLRYLPFALSKAIFRLRHRR